MIRLHIQRLSGPPATWRQRLLLWLTGALALVLTAAILVTGFFIALAVLGVVIAVSAVIWVRNRLFGKRRGTPQGPRRPVVIEGEYVVLSRKPRP